MLIYTDNSACASDVLFTNMFVDDTNVFVKNKDISVITDMLNSKLVKVS